MQTNYQLPNWNILNDIKIKFYFLYTKKKKIINLSNYFITKSVVPGKLKFQMR